MKMRTTKPPAKTASGATSHHETGSARYIKYHNNPYGTMVLTICQTARASDGSWYSATIAFHRATSLSCSSWFKSAIITDEKYCPASSDETIRPSVPLRNESSGKIFGSAFIFVADANIQFSSARIVQWLIFF